MASSATTSGAATVMSWSIQMIQFSEEVSRCAQLMAETDPWKRLNFSKGQCEQNLKHPQIRLHGAVRESGLVIGFLASAQYGVGLEPLLEYLCIDSECRNKGVGTKLIEYFESTLYPEARNLYLFVSDINPNAQRLYLRLGYLPVGAIPNYNLEMQTEFLFRKTRGPKQVGQLYPSDS
jgi:ribosomal protein S18 acetylase RimI-like enzyme